MAKGPRIDLILNAITKGLDEGLTKAEKKIVDFSKRIKTQTTVGGQIGMGFNNMLQQLKPAENAFGGIYDKIMSVKAGLVGVLAVGYAAFKLAKGWGAFETAFARIRLEVEAAGYSLTNMIEQVRGVGITFGVSGAVAANALHEILENGVPAAQAIDALQIAAKAAVGGFTDLESTSKMLIKTANAMEIEYQNLGYVTDKMFQAAKLGSFSFADLSRVQENLVVAGGNAGATLNDLYAALVQMTNQGISAETASENLVRMIGEINRPSEEAQAACDELGIAIGEGAIQAEGFINVINGLNEAAQNNPGLERMLFTSRQARKAFTALTKDIEGLNEAQNKMYEDSDASSEAYRNAQETFGQRMKELWAVVQDLLLTIGEPLAQIVMILSNYLIPALKMINITLKILLIPLKTIFYIVEKINYLWNTTLGKAIDKLMGINEVPKGTFKEEKPEKKPFVPPAEREAKKLMAGLSEDFSMGRLSNEEKLKSLKSIKAFMEENKLIYTSGYKEINKAIYEAEKEQRDNRKEELFDEIEMMDIVESKKIKLKMEKLKELTALEKTSALEREKNNKELRKLEIQLLKENRKEDKEALKEKKEAEKKAFQEQVNRVEHLSELGQITVQEEITRLETILKQENITAEDKMKLEKEVYKLKKSLREEDLQEELNKIEFLGEKNEYLDSQIYRAKIITLRRYLNELDKNGREAIEIKRNIDKIEMAMELATLKEVTEARKEALAEQFKEIEKERRIGDEKEKYSDLRKIQEKIDLLKEYSKMDLGRKEQKERAKELHDYEIQLEEEKYKVLEEMAKEYGGTQQEYLTGWKEQILEALKHVKKGSEKEILLEKQLALVKSKITRSSWEEAIRFHDGLNKNVSKNRYLELLMSKQMIEKVVKDEQIKGAEKTKALLHQKHIEEDLKKEEEAAQKLRGAERDKRLAEIEEAKRQAEEAAKQEINFVDEETRKKIEADKKRTESLSTYGEEAKKAFSIASTAVDTFAENFQDKMVKMLDIILQKLDEFKNSLGGILGALQGMAGGNMPINLPGGSNPMKGNIINKPEVNINKIVIENMDGSRYEAEKAGEKISEKMATEYYSSTGGRK